MINVGGSQWCGTDGEEKTMANIFFFMISNCGECFTFWVPELGCFKATWFSENGCSAPKLGIQNLRHSKSLVTLKILPIVLSIELLVLVHTAQVGNHCWVLWAKKKEVVQERES